MRITDVKMLAEVSIPLSEPTTMAFHNPRAKSRTPLRWNVGVLCVETDEGIAGISECPRGDSLQTLKPKLLGRDPFDVEALVQEMTGVYFGKGSYPSHGSSYYWTCAAVEIACWDIMGKAARVPACKLLGGKVWEKIPITRFIGVMPPNEAAKEAVAAVEAGVGAIKLKVGLDPKQDIEIVRAVREAVGDGPVLRVDANQAWTVGTAINQIRKLARYDLQYIEQPIARWDREGLVRLRERVDVPICVCEGWGYEHQADKMQLLLRLIQDHALDFLSTDPYRTGGLLGFKKVCAICEAAGIPVISHWNTLGVSTAVWLHACASNRAAMFGHDILCSNLKPGPVDDIVTAPFRHDRGYLRVPEAPGLGVALDEAKLKKRRIEPGTPLMQPDEEVCSPIENLQVRSGYAPPRY